MDPQHLSLRGKISALIALGRIPFATEVPLWCLFGCLTSSQVFESVAPKGEGAFRNLDWWATVQCMLIVWGTNVSINYGNEYFDYDLDRPGMVASIKRDIKARKELEEKHSNGEMDHKEAEEEQGKVSEKMMNSTTRIIHDGTFPPVTTLLLGLFVQVLLFTMIYLSRNTSQFADSRPGEGDSPFRGFALKMGIMCTILSQEYVGPPLRLHYRGWGELISALFLSPVSFLFGLLGHYTASTGSPVVLSDLFASPSQSSSGFYLDTQAWTLLGSFYCFEQARIFIMHIHDIDVDILGRKLTFCVKVGQNVASRLYIVFNGLCALFTYMIFRQQKAHQGMLLRVGGYEVNHHAADQLGVGWKTGAIVIGSYALPIVLVTAKSLFEDLERKKKSTGLDRVVYKLFPGWIPTMTTENCAKLVSVKTMVTPAVLCLTLTFTVLAVVK